MWTSLSERNAYQRRWRLKNRARVNANLREWKKKNPEKVRKSQRKYWAANKEKLIAKRARFRTQHPDYDKKYTRRIREEALHAYGDTCFCCGEWHYEFLAIDHIEGGGTKHRRELNISGQKFYFWLRRNNYPKGYRVACHCCNMSLGLYGYCPHSKEKKCKTQKKKYTQ